MPRALWWLLACSRTASAVLMTTATRAATTNDWGAVPGLLKRREVSAVFVEDAASLIDGAGWATALEGAHNGEDEAPAAVAHAPDAVVRERVRRLAQSARDRPGERHEHTELGVASAKVGGGEAAAARAV